MDFRDIDRADLEVFEGCVLLGVTVTVVLAAGPQRRGAAVDVADAHSSISYQSVALRS